MKLDGFGLFVENMDDMICFYNLVLDFEIMHEQEDSNVCLKRDGVSFFMYPRCSFEEMVGQKFRYPKGYNGTFEIVLSVENYQAVDDAFESLVAKGAKPVMAPVTGAWGKRFCYIADPEGNFIKIGSSVVGDFKEE